MFTDSNCPYFSLTEDQKRSLMRHIKRIARLYDEHTEDPLDASRVYRMDGPNPNLLRRRMVSFLHSVMACRTTSGRHGVLGLLLLLSRFRQISADLCRG